MSEDIFPDRILTSQADEFVNDDSLDGEPDGDRQLTSESDALDTGLNDSDLGAGVAGDIGPKHR